MNDADMTAEILRLLKDVETATVSHILSGGFLAPQIQCLTDGIRIVGP